MKKSVFVKKANLKHSIPYLYDRVPDWVNTQDKEYVEVGCPNCNEYFRVRYDSFLAGSNCKKCTKTGRKVTPIEEFIRRAKLIHGDKYTYEKVTYNTLSDFIIIHCKVHGDFDYLTATGHLEGSGCRQCAIEAQTYKTIEFLKEAELVFPNQFTFDIDSDFLPADKLFTVTCKKCGNSFKKNRRTFFMSGCKYCGDGKWKGEKLIKEYFESNSTSYETPKYFDDLRDVEPLSYDFYIESRNLLIEYNGIQHYKEVPFFHRDPFAFHKQLHHDWLKRKYARDHNINLEVISYKDKNKIPKILEEILKKYPEK